MGKAPCCPCYTSMKDVAHLHCWTCLAAFKTCISKAPLDSRDWATADYHGGWTTLLARTISSTTFVSPENHSTSVCQLEQRPQRTRKTRATRQRGSMVIQFLPSKPLPCLQDKTRSAVDADATNLTRSKMDNREPIRVVRSRNAIVVQQVPSHREAAKDRIDDQPSLGVCATASVPARL